MKIDTIDKSPVTIVTLTGNVMQEDVGVFRTTLTDLMESGKVQIVLDLNGVNFLSSMCLAVIVESKKNLEKNNGDLKIAVSNFLVKNLFDLTRLSHKLDMHTTVEEAVLAFS